MRAEAPIQEESFYQSFKPEAGDWVPPPAKSRLSEETGR